jgi:glycosyltransferase involved in cell wall biosynthesis
MNLGIVVLHMQPWRGGVDAALYTLIQEWRETVKMTVYYSQLDERARLDGVTYVPLHAIPYYRFNIEALSCGWRWRRLVGRGILTGSHDILYSNHYPLIPCDALTIHFCALDYQALRGSTVQGGEERGGGLVRRLYQGIEVSLAARLEQQIYSRIEREGGGRLHAVSSSVAEAIRSRFPRLDPVVIPNPVSLGRFLPSQDGREKWAWIRRQTGWSEDVWRHLFVGGGWERKGLATAIEGLALANPDVVLMVVGKGPVPTYRRLAERLGVADRVFFAGPQTDIPLWHAVSDLFVFPSHYEAMPVVCIEALASGLPVLCTPFKGVEMFLKEGENGFTVTTPRDLAVRSAALRRDPLGYGAMRRKAVESVRRYDAPQVAADMLDFLKASRQKGRGP